MSLPLVAIVGRPNVGKSSLFNALARRRISIVDPTAGVTRDRISTIVESGGRYFELVDTGGYGVEDCDDLTEPIRVQIQRAVEQAQLVLFVVDVREGITSLDVQVAHYLRRCSVEVLPVANKADAPELDALAGEFFSLGFEQALCVSALQGRNLQTLLEAICGRLPADLQERPAEAAMKIAIVGKRNVGKSTLINSMVGQERLIVSEVPGTTRDAVDVRFEKDGRVFVAIDTAGVRKKGKIIRTSIEFYGYTRVLHSIRRADVVLFLLDSIAEISQVDKKLTRLLIDHYKPCIIVINKWDLAKDRATTEQYREYIDRMLPGLGFAPISFITATEGKNVLSLLDLASNIHKQACATVSTGQLNKALSAVIEERPPSARRKVGVPKIYYGTQVAQNPPILLLFVNNPHYLDENYQRYLVNRLRALLPFSEVPIRLLLRHHRQDPIPQTR